ncbi:Hypothetical protein, putative [Bodo saltans]|uniref:Uncharacterized protein n=1 Tax=Bodo saltans TaxID=75058 RepID=A0A0S4JX87_BODSA|nr:Hypothetical protein, putative [Bodo saltans]|eukprot:CUG93195.1 Hypothetical protein, putative [Bodo saltans]
MLPDDFVDVALLQVQKTIRGGFQQDNEGTGGSGPATASSPPRSLTQRLGQDDTQLDHWPSPNVSNISSTAEVIIPQQQGPSNSGNEASVFARGVAAPEATAPTISNIVAAPQPSLLGHPPVAPKLQHKAAPTTATSTLTSLASGGGSKSGTTLRDEASLLLRVVEEQRGIIYDLTTKRDVLIKTISERDEIIQSRDATIRELRALIDTADRRLLDAQHSWDNERDALEARHLRQQEALLVKLLSPASDQRQPPTQVVDAPQHQQQVPVRSLNSSAAVAAPNDDSDPRSDLTSTSTVHNIHSAHTSSVASSLSYHHLASQPYKGTPENDTNTTTVAPTKESISGSSAATTKLVAAQTHEIHVQTLPETISAAIQTTPSRRQYTEEEERRVQPRRVLSSPPRDEVLRHSELIKEETEAVQRQNGSYSSSSYDGQQYRLQHAVQQHHTPPPPAGQHHHYLSSTANSSYPPHLHPSQLPAVPTSAYQQEYSAPPPPLGYYPAKQQVDPRHTMVPTGRYEGATDTYSTSFPTVPQHSFVTEYQHAAPYAPAVAPRSSPPIPYYPIGAAPPPVLHDSLGQHTSRDHQPYVPTTALPIIVCT